jgi:hypothetical protein
MTIRRSRNWPRCTYLRLADIAREINPILQGWLNYGDHTFILVEVGGPGRLRASVLGFAKDGSHGPQDSGAW